MFSVVQEAQAACKEQSHCVSQASSTETSATDAISRTQEKNVIDHFSLLHALQYRGIAPHICNCLHNHDAVSSNQLQIF